jgi:dTDP-4-amino-4,6-dideoxygalactose transaminase
VHVLRSERWTISGPNTGEKARERSFAEAFAKYHHVPYCVPTANGSAALTIALEAIGVGPGMEVLVPALTWVACASAVSRVGAIPVLVDIDPCTLCMSVEAARQAVTSATAAILLVHLYCTIADLESFCQFSSEAGLPLIEDCSHAHGALWRGAKVGTFGTVGAFSMQQSKVLTSGEGGAVITSDADLYDRLQQLRADGRTYAHQPARGDSELEAGDRIQGHNYCLSEFHSAILLDRLSWLDGENYTRAANASELTRRLSRFVGVQPLHLEDAECSPTFYRYCVHFDRRHLGHLPIDLLAEALRAELALPIHTLYDPLNTFVDGNHSAYRASSTTSASDSWLPVASAARQNWLAIPHNALLGGPGEIADIDTAVAKLLCNYDELRSFNAARGIIE